MEKEIKTIKPEDLKKINDLDFQFKTVTLKVGNLSLEESSLLDQLDNVKNLKNNLLSEYKNLQLQEIEMNTYIQTNYGTGVLDLNTGILTLE